MKDSERLLNESEVADMLGVTVSCLRRWRYERRGPRFIKLGRLVRYPARDLADWIEARGPTPPSGLTADHAAALSASGEDI